MSDDDDFMLEDEEEDYDFDYDDEEEEPDVDLENKYYNAKAKKEDDLKEALEEFQSTLKYYRELLTYVKSAVTRNYSEKSINNILDYVSSTDNMSFMESFYETTLESLKENKNENYGDDGTDDQRKGTHLLEILALEIQMYTETKNNKKLKDLYQQCLSVKSAIPHPRIMGVIRECGGKMHMSEKQWDNAQTDFFESFKNYDEAGSPQRIQVLKYYVLANMLTESQINPFDSQETKPYKNDKEIEAMTNLVSAYQKRDINEFEHILKVNQKAIMGDPFIYIDDVLKNIRTQVLIKLIKPYTSIEIASTIAKVSEGIVLSVDYVY
ncbi:uncharacterized protein BX663DRAFT_518715 [Cokeromyces recurvatus]|uniref:uncharacterized protein n=1 Tax=Cokeromyces recurvatus TaxID=90255 RepID=UPI00221EF8C7|nr:uncharacterized protein BX663DRAFT_522457 [Cokeromyces recurvatus]XP_051380123.1 uncharacterized protein BX663DRAFT_518715 [Cokeromyces recurvatus]KAI7899148.1 hypothetical protein BX663DRAFT_522457 [Cokeromyces recurvatus]KAI7900138.1 hypothetical protein BX663DRAFT_518715 [Cokeromyces recurvatus]